MPSHPRVRVIGCLVLAFVGGVVSACTHSTSTAGTPASADTPAQTTTAPTAAVRLHVTLTQYRVDEGTRKVNAEVTNDGSTPFTVTSVALTSPLTVQLPATTQDTVFAPGQTIDLQTRYGDPRCRTEHRAGSSFTLGLDGLPSTSVPLDRSGLAFLNRLHTRECGVARVAAVADVALSQHFSRVTIGGVPYLRGQIDVVRSTSGHPGEALTVQSLYGSVLLDFSPLPSAVPLPATLEPGTQSLRIPVLLGSSNRCDAHALSGSTQTFLLSVFVRLRGIPQQRIIVTPTPAGRAKTGALLHDVCHPG